LEQLKLGSEANTYSKRVDSVVLGPRKVNMDDVEIVLGIDGEAFAESNKKRNDLISGGIQPSWTQKVETTIVGPRRRTKRTLSLGTLEGKRKAPMEDRNAPLQPTHLYDQFELFSKFGRSGSDGAEITLSQSQPRILQLLSGRFHMEPSGWIMMLGDYFLRSLQAEQGFTCRRWWKSLKCVANPD
jgi:hypothetical protein